VEWVNARWWSLAAGASLVFATGSLASQVAQRPAPLSPLLLTQLDERAPSADLDNRTVTITFAEPLAMRDLLLQLVRGTSLSVVAGSDVGGTFIGELKNVTIRQALDLTLKPLGLDYVVDDTRLRVFRRQPETRIFDLNYLATERVGSSSIAVTEAGSTAGVSQTTKSDVFTDVTAGLKTLLSDRAAFNVDRKAGLVQVTDFPERLDRVAVYLDAVQDRVHRQAQIDARVIEIELGDQKAAGVDWAAVAARMTSTADLPAGAPRPVARPSLTGLRVGDVARLMSVLEEQGRVTVVASPRLLTLNNEPSIVRTDVVTFSVTPQIAGDGLITVSLSPIVKTPLVHSDLLARVADGETLVISGFTRDHETREREAAGTSGGWFGRSSVVTRRRIELVILLTPKIVSGVLAQ
jgi:type II secretory pathway component GspD/PulD (secretin)